MKLLFDFFPVFLFFIAYQMYDIYVATAVLIVASLIQTVGHRLIHGSFEKTHLITLVLVLLLGGATLILQNEMFIKWKPSVINWLFAAAFIGSHFIGGKTLTQRMMDGQIELPQAVWQRLNGAWAIFFTAMGLLNLYVVYNFSTDIWMNFKMFGLMGLTLAFIIAQGFYVARYLPREEPAAEE